MIVRSWAVVLSCPASRCAGAVPTASSTQAPPPPLSTRGPPHTPQTPQPRARMHPPTHPRPPACHPTSARASPQCSPSCWRATQGTARPSRSCPWAWRGGPGGGGRGARRGTLGRPPQRRPSSSWTACPSRASARAGGGAAGACVLLCLSVPACPWAHHAGGGAAGARTPLPALAFASGPVMPTARRFWGAAGAHSPLLLTGRAVHRPCCSQASQTGRAVKKPQQVSH